VGMSVDAGPHFAAFHRRDFKRPRRLKPIQKLAEYRSGKPLRHPKSSIAG
jgi:hypothetical protein